MRGQVLRSGVCLDFDDARLTPPGLVVADEASTQQARGDDLRRAGEPVAIEDAQAAVE
jgi:hypothetical protein